VHAGAADEGDALSADDLAVDEARAKRDGPPHCHQGAVEAGATAARTAGTCARDHNLLPGTDDIVDDGAPGTPDATILLLLVNLSLPVTLTTNVSLAPRSGRRRCYHSA